MTIKASTRRSARAATKYINDTYAKLSRILVSSGRPEYHERYFDAHLTEERQHRQGLRVAGINRRLAAKLLYCQYILRYRAGQRAPRAEDYYRIRPSVFGAWALYCEFQKQIDAVFTPTDAAEFQVSADYSRLMAGDFDIHFSDGK